jgi:cytidine deaminase
MVQKEGEAPRFYRGINAEVSLPTGSLCSERNAIGQALALDMGLQRKDLKMIAVLSLTLTPRPRARPSQPPTPQQTAQTAATGRPHQHTASIETLELPPALAKPVLRRHRTTTEFSSTERSDSMPRLEHTGSMLNVEEAEPNNPIYPCGACTEWLKKISETNPDFKVIAFTDESCTLAYVRPVGGW